LISRLNEKSYKASIKTTMLGKDAAKSEYWHFKDDNTRIYIRMEEEIPIETEGGAIGNTEMVDESSNKQDLAIQKESTQVESMTNGNNGNGV